MAKEESKIVEAVEELTVETTEQKSEGIEDKFNPLAFTEDVYGESETKKES